MAAAVNVVQPPTKYVGIVLFNNFEELDAVGPLEVFGVTEHLQKMSRGSVEPVDGGDISQVTGIRYHPITISVPGNEGGKQVRAANGLTVVTDYAAGDPLMPPLDVLVVPGSQGIRDIPNSQGVAEWLAELCKSATWVTSVCTGVFLLHQAGYTKGKRVATHFWAEDELESLGDVTVVRDQRWVVDGNLVTSQGVSAGIDLSLWLVGQLHSPAHALKTQKVMQYHPDPPYQAGGEQEAEHSA